MKKSTFLPHALALAVSLTAAADLQADNWKHKDKNNQKHSHNHKHGHNHNHKHNSGKYFERLATFPVYRNLDLNAGDQLSDTTAAEISAASRDGTVVYYSNSPKGRVGMIDIRDPANPMAAGFIEVDGEPTSVAVSGNYLFVGVNTSPTFTAPSGKLAVYKINKALQPKFVTELELGGQPDSVAISPDGRYAAIAIENERDEDFNDGLIPQQPGGFLAIVDLKRAPKHWQVEKVDLSGLAEIAPDDPEVEYVAINRFNIAALTLQENNHIVLVDLRRARVINHFSAGSVDLHNVDAVEDDVINPVDSILNRRREPDAITWVHDLWLATANEGDYEDENGEEGGSRGFTMFNMFGAEKYEAGGSFERALIRAGHYPESRSENKGSEPEGITNAQYGRDDLMFVGSERGNVIAVYDVNHHRAPTLRQLLPTTVAPEGILPIPQRNLLVVSSEEDSADDGIRSTVSIYRYGAKQPEYPQIASTPDALVSWGALSGLVADQRDAYTLYAVPDSYYAQSRIFTIDVSQHPALITGSTVLNNNGATVDYDLEGIAQRSDGGFWLASEGDGGSRPNLLIQVDGAGNVLREVALPAAVVAQQKSNGFEGVAVVGEGADEKVLVAFQREWNGDPAGLVRIGVYTPATDAWGFYYYPLDPAQPGTWIGLSELTAIDSENFLVIERDNQVGDKAAMKRLYRFSIADLVPAAEGESFPQLDKTLVQDLMPELQAANGWVVDKIEGSAIAADGEVYVVSDNDGVEDASGETRFMRLGRLFD